MTIPMRMVVMGVSGSGKTSVGEMLAERLPATFIDGDQLHPAANIAKMSQGIPLTDEDRWPWLTIVGQTLGEGHGPRIIGCSALKRAYRDHIIASAGGPVTFIHLAGTFEVVSARMNSRTGHFMPPSLLESQFAALEPLETDESAIVVDIDQPLEALVDQIVEKLGGSNGGRDRD